MSKLSIDQRLKNANNYIEKCPQNLESILKFLKNFHGLYEEISKNYSVESKPHIQADMLASFALNALMCEYGQQDCAECMGNFYMDRKKTLNKSHNWRIKK